MRPTEQTSLASRYGLGDLEENGTREIGKGKRP
jgi:hypothetical protein